MLSGIINCAGNQARTVADSFATINSYFQEEGCSFRFWLLIEAITLQPELRKLTVGYREGSSV